MPKYLYDLKKPEESWSGISHSKFPNGEISSDVGSVTPPVGPHRLYWCLDSVMHKNPEGTDSNITQMPHYHRHGVETFFIDSGEMILYINGQRAHGKPGDIVHLQAGQPHGMFWLEDVKWRGTYHDFAVPDEVMQVGTIQALMPEYAEDPELLALNPGMDHIKCEPFLCKDVEPEECLAIKNPSRPHAAYELEGVTVKIIVERWENGGVKELALAEMQPGFKAEWKKFPELQELLYVRKGKVKFKVMNEEFIADDECIVSIPRFAPHSCEALEYSEVYDLGGQTYWSNMMQDIAAIKKYDPARLENPETMETLKKKYDCMIKSISK